ncbi:GGDEF domain-containing protein [Magnetospirillum molischianum]|uniref:Response regulator containing a CheY-like receiver domain and a GGDEF domain n=1 Tax=Magnetospirillum molischianum DSM 120 TaxID=1150626 RepID=H8FPG3_MAGML|nr:GGDEF domain-containing protein [Magnetospirillum molischianum]CCG40251.1 Response regulator containing a CheY-like receiver domain and a GGDEF domain [Magnetospirillum molischianum DSM 120]
MANEFRTDPLIPVTLTTGGGREREPHGFGHAPHSPYPPPEPPRTEHSTTDVASILGLPDSVVTPAVMTAITGLLGELDRLRWAESLARRRLTHLETLADQDSLVPIPNRRGFMRTVETLMASGAADGTLVVLHVSGIEQIRQQDGMAAGEAALRHICANLVGALRTTDPRGLLGGSDFGLVLVSTGLAVARTKVREMMEQINLLPFVWQGRSHSFAMFSGYHILQAGENAEMAVAAADRARRGAAN